MRPAGVEPVTFGLKERRIYRARHESHRGTSSICASPSFGAF